VSDMGLTLLSVTVASAMASLGAAHTMVAWRSGRVNVPGRVIGGVFVLPAAVAVLAAAGAWGHDLRSSRAGPGQPIRGETGSVTLWLVIMTVAMFGAIGLVSDGGRALAVKGRAIAEAYGAARAGAEALDQGGFARGGPPTPDVAAAQGAAAAFLASAGVPAGQYQIVVNAQEVTVTVHLSSPTPILSAIGVGPRNVSGRGNARAIYGLRGPQP
jgi:hypothetical protein